MAIRAYVKEKQKGRVQTTVHLMSYVSLMAGAVLLFWAYYPIISFEIYSRLFINQILNTPIPRSEIATSLSNVQQVLGSYNAFSSNLRDFVQANVWFPSKPQNLVAINLAVKKYTMSIPKLNINNAQVLVGGEDLSKSLVHYLPQSLPGEYGNVAIFGHSTLPQMYNVKDYKTIFTHLPSLEKGDKVYATVENREYEYEVYDMFIVKPEQVSVLEQKLDDAYLTLITCVPPGTYWNRLVVRAKMVKR
ncbi:hypothetical protein A3F03_04560 [Candidatus Roizmanbacteria bacterium RIFCSPHIGHO2_12_FULL_41_11]|uniref:Sortase n=3 Tax=Candidatus Roizmaniibacteriota TaxID=1752723 RepID=A0A1F7JQW0_9BACT|nr:MAG: hypothetical protein A3F03_04560 [Candidatus Roizmanbacteria bacterium RIFCSPHIGHO2_12_FULL_41_11]OGK51457.1 MAG: hypothetical protein A2966_00070 [Candidatus Roizmanbacteria bacterium RIFCSPLOWO2_01_FULL_41_22]OGK57982.1 MAG: hypothetical protein A3H86_00075 [Candidatus Roizmanbacteria bacterium RIFCSPLOWO2_02_FULL_41_9]